MNRNIWTWIQLAISVSNTTFLVISHVPTPVSAVDIACRLVGQSGHRVLAKAAQGVNPLSHQVAARL